ncbi:MAG: lysophospholipid acyltransferase family protein [Egibacteraceae bacterium]
MELVYPPVIGMVVTMFKVMGWLVSVEGAERIPAEGPGVVATNHVSYLDFTFVGYGARRNGRLTRFLAKKEIFDHRVAGPLMRGMRHIPVDRFGRPADALEAAIAALGSGELIGMFPEATISRSFVPMSGKNGAACMALAVGAPLIPGAVWGGQRLMTKGLPRNLQRGVPISVLFGEPVPYKPDEDPAEVTRRLMVRITELVDRAAATYPDQPAGDHDRWWLPAHLGGTAPTVAEARELARREAAARRALRRGQVPPTSRC